MTLSFENKSPRGGRVMSISSIATGVQDAASTAGTAIVDAAKWAGRMIQTGFGEVVKLVQSAWNSASPFIKTTADAASSFLRTFAGFGVVGLIVAGATKIVGEKYFEEHKKVVNVAAIAIAVVSVAAIGAGFATGVMVPVI